MVTAAIPTESADMVTAAIPTESADMVTAATPTESADTATAAMMTEKDTVTAVGYGVDAAALKVGEFLSNTIS